MLSSAVDKMATTTTTTMFTDNVEGLFLFYRLKVGRTYFAMLLTTNVVFHVVYVILRRTFANEVRRPIFSTVRLTERPHKHEEKDLRREVRHAL